MHTKAATTRKPPPSLLHPPEPPDCLPAFPVQDKVMAYITRGRRLLVSRHPDAPEAGFQLPGGSLRPGEAPWEGVLREVCEETGLTQLSAPRWLAWQWVDASSFGKQELHRRWFFHLICHQETAQRWIHFEQDPSSGEDGPIALEWSWVPAPGNVPTLSGLQGGLLPLLWKSLGWPSHR